MLNLAYGSFDGESNHLDAIHQQWTATLDASRDSIVVVDDEGRIICANQAFACLVVCEIEALIYQEITEFWAWLIADDRRSCNVVHGAEDKLKVLVSTGR